MTWLWNEIKGSQIEGKVFYTWSSSGKARNVDFTVDCIDEMGITFRKQNGKMQRVPRVAAENVIENWDRYKEGQISRAELSVNNFSTSYLFGLLHGLDIDSVPNPGDSKLDLTGRA